MVDTKNNINVETAMPNSKIGVRKGSKSEIQPKRIFPTKDPVENNEKIFKAVDLSNS